MSVNKVILLGRLGQDPEMKYTPTGAAVCSFSLATSEFWTDKSGQKQTKTEWHRIVAWGKTAELCSKYLGKGREVYLEGRLQTRSWDGKDGQKRYTTEINASIIQFVGANTSQSRDQAVNTGPMNDDNAAPTENLENYNISTEANFTADDIPF